MDGCVVTKQRADFYNSRRNADHPGSQRNLYVLRLGGIGALSSISFLKKIEKYLQYFKFIFSDKISSTEIRVAEGEQTWRCKIKRILFFTPGVPTVARFSPKHETKQKREECS